MRTAIKKILAIVLALCMVATGLNISNAKAATETNVANVSTSNIFLTSNANNGSEGFLSVGNGFSAINACNESLTSGNNLLGATATTDEAAIYIDLGNNYDISRALIYQGSTNSNYYDSYCKNYNIYYSTQQVTAENEGNITWNLAGTCTSGTIYSGAKVKNAENVSDSGDAIAFSGTYTARSVKVVFDKGSCMGTGTNGNGTGTTGTVSLLSVRVYGLQTTNQGESTTAGDDGVTDILFIGNSFMYYNTVWNVVKGLANYNGHNVSVTAATNGGQNLIYQSTADNVLNSIKKGGYDIVILQDKVGSNFDMNTLLNGSEEIIPIIKEYNPDAQLVYYEPWPTKDQIASKMSYFTSSYITAARTYNAKLAPAGEGFYDLYTNYGLDYYCSDNRHPQPLGTFNSASTIYYTLFPEDTQKIYTAADQTYIDNLINTNVAYTSEGQLSTYDLTIINLISALSYKYSHEVIGAVNGTDTYTSISDRVDEPTIEVTTPSEEMTTDSTEDVLFIGNSMTYYNTLCNVVKGIAAKKGHTINTTAATNGGQTILYQSTAENVLTAIKKGGYETVVLQDIVGGFDDGKLQLGAEAIIPIIKKYNPSAKIIFYMPWPTKDTITGTGSLLPYFTNSYIKTAKSMNAAFAPAGEAFYELYVENGLDFYCADNKHPQPLGTFTSASTIYYTLYPEEAYSEYSTADQAYLDNLINTNVAYTNEGKQDTYSLDTLNLINSLGYKYSRAVENAVNGTGSYTSVAGEYHDIDADLNPSDIKATQGTVVDSSLFSKANGNIAVGCSAKASSGESGAANATDGNTSSRWESSFADPQWLYIDLGAVKAFDTVGFIWEGAYATKYYIQISNDANDWTTISYVTATSPKTVQISLDKTYHAKYIRMIGTKRGTVYGYSFYEMGVWNKADAEDPEQPTGIETQTVAQTTYDGTIENISINTPTVTSILGDVQYRSVAFSWAKATNATKYTTYVGSEEDGIVAKAYHNNYLFKEIAQASVDHLKAEIGKATTFTVVGYNSNGDVVARGTVSVTPPELTDEEKALATLISKITTDENLAKSGTPFVSSNSATNITDGNLGSNWQADPSLNPDDNPSTEAFGVNLGIEKTFNTVIIAWENSYATAYDIYVAGSDEIYGDVPIASGTASGNNPIVVTEFDNVKAQYVKIVPTALSANAKTYGTCVYELAVISKAEENEQTTEFVSTENQTSVETTVAQTTQVHTTVADEKPEKPSGLIIGDNNIIQWTGGASSYNVYVNGALVGSTVVNSYDISGVILSAGNYSIEVRGVNAQGIESDSAYLTVIKEDATSVSTSNTITTKSNANIKPPKKVTVKKVLKKKKSAKKLSLTVKKVSGAVGYQIKVYSSSKNAKKNKKSIFTKTVKKAKITLKSNKLKNKKKIYLKVRAYTLDENRTKVYGLWSKIKKVKVV